jgi:Rho GTPase-activating protein 18/28/40
MFLRVQMLLKFLKDVVATVEYNKMTLRNVAMIIAPNLFFVPTSSDQHVASARRVPKSAKDLIEVSMAAETSNIVQILIHYQQLLWQVCCYFAAVVIHDIAYGYSYWVINVQTDVESVV